jgi:hypothetical protein
LEAQNQLHVWLYANHRERRQVWNDIVDRHKTEVIAPLIKEKNHSFPTEARAGRCTRPCNELGCVGCINGEFVFGHSPSSAFLPGTAMGVRGWPFSMRLARRLVKRKVDRALIKQAYCLNSRLAQLPQRMSPLLADSAIRRVSRRFVRGEPWRCGSEGWSVAE